MGLFTELVNQLVLPQAVSPRFSVFLADTLCTLFGLFEMFLSIFFL